MSSTRHSQIEIKKTKDGSNTAFSVLFNQHYHNPNGAVTESIHVFFDSLDIKTRLAQGKRVNIFETGFGTGLNLLLLLSLRQKLGSNSPVRYFSVEANPIPATVALNINREQVQNLENSNEIIQIVFNALNEAKGLSKRQISDNITVELFHGDFSRIPVNTPDYEADFIFHDPFSPDVNPELWNVTVFKKIKSIAESNVLLATYCAASKARAAMVAAGWHVVRAPGALGKREMTVAALNPGILNRPTWKRLNEKRLADRFYPDQYPS